MDKLRVIPQSPGYGITPPAGEVIGSDIPGGLPGLSSDIEGGCSTIDVTFMLDAADWQYFEAFYRNRISNGPDPFLIDLILNGSDITEHVAMFVPETKRLTGAVADMRILAAQLYVLPAEVDAAADSSIVDIYEASDGDVQGYVNGFELIINNLPVVQ